ncbi:Phosphoribulokinase/uridine kinase [Pelagophyceae sp. CCMP2097]|nr:Phosphoribulokinase/uridine kinase [Pelagophyceae sp. CCMP2097]
MIGVAGGTASGKTALTEKIVQQLGEAEAVCITMDSFYRDLTPLELERVEDYNFDVPEAFDFEQCYQVLSALRRGDRGVRIPEYDFVANARRPPTCDTVLGEPNIVVFEGILALYDRRLCDLFDVKIFVDADADVRLARRIRRDIAARGRDVDGVLRQYERFVKPSFDDFCFPTKRNADVVVPRGAENNIAIDLIVHGIRERAGNGSHNRL